MPRTIRTSIRSSLAQVVCSTIFLFALLVGGPFAGRSAADPTTTSTRVEQASASSAAGSSLTKPPSRATDPGVIALHKTAATSGFLAYGLMVGTVAWGILTTTGLARRSVRRQTLYGGHMTMSIMSLSFILIHIVANVFNPKGTVSALGAIIPFGLSQPIGITLGVVSTELLVAVAVSVWFQRLVSYRRWHAFHRLGYPAYALAVLHTFISGSDVREGLIATGLIASLTAVIALFIFRAVPSTSLVRTRIAPVES